MIRVLRLWPTLLIGASIGVLVVMAGGIGFVPLLEQYDQRNPVVVAQGQVIEATSDHVLIHVQGRKVRACQYVSLAGYWRMADGELMDAYEERSDMPPSGLTKPVGSLDFGIWRIYPRRAGAVGVVLFTSHNCGGRLVMSKIADVSLQ